MQNYQNITDEELVSKYREGTEEIMEYILTKYKPLVRKKANALYLIGGETDDLIQEGMIGLFKAIRDFDKDKESSFYHFAEMCITRQMYTAIESSQRMKHAPLNSYISLYEGDDAEGGSLVDSLESSRSMNPETLVIGRESLDQMSIELRKQLSKMEIQVFDYILQGMDYQQIAKKMNRLPKSIDNALQRIKSKIARNSL